MCLSILPPKTHEVKSSSAGESVVGHGSGGTVGTPNRVAEQTNDPWSLERRES